MKISFVAPLADRSGGIRVIAIHAEHLRKRGHEVLVVSQPRPRPTLRRRIRSLLRGSAAPVISQGSHLDGVEVPHRILERCRPITDGDLPNADVVVATWWETAEWVARLSPRKGAKAYFIQGHETFDYLPRERVAATYRLPLHKITISRWLVDLMRDQYGDDRVSLVLNSVDTRQFHAPPRGKQPIPTVGLLYYTMYLKGCRTSFEAVSLARREMPDLRVVAFGQEDPSPDLPLPTGTSYLKQPPQDEIKDIYARCDVWLCGSQREGFHLPPLEAMACRCPVVSTAVGGPIDRIENGRNGYLVPVGDHAALAGGLSRVLALPEAGWRAMSDAAYATATSYTWDDAADLLERALQVAVERTRRAR